MFVKKDITTIQLAEQAISKIRSDGSNLRREDMKKRLDYYYGKQLNYLDDLIDKQFQYPERLKLQKEFLNITEMIINELAILYSKPPKRELINSSEELEMTYQEYMEKAQINSILALVNKLTKLCKTTLVRPVWRNEKLEYDIYTPNMFDVIQDPSNPTKAVGIVYAVQLDFENAKRINNEDYETLDIFNQDKTIFYLWTDTHYFSFTYSIQADQKIKVSILDDQDNPDHINPYGIIPFVPFYDGVPLNDFFVEGGDDLINTNEINNIKLVEKNHLTKMQSFSIPVRKGADNTNDEIILDPSMIVNIPADDDMKRGIDFKFISPDAKLQEMDDDIQKRLTRIALKYRLNPEMFKASGERSSADSLQMQAYYMSKAINADKPVYAYYEKELFNVTKTILGIEAGILFPDDVGLFIDYYDIEMPKTIEQNDAHNIIMYANGLMSKTDWIMEENPDIRDYDQAKQKLKEIMEEKKENMQAMAQQGIIPQINQDQDNQEEDQEDEQ